MEGAVANKRRQVRPGPSENEDGHKSWQLAVYGSAVRFKLPDCFLGPGSACDWQISDWMAGARLLPLVLRLRGYKLGQGVEMEFRWR